MKKIQKWGWVMLTFFLAQFSYADASKIGVVDLQKVVQTSDQMKTIQQNLQTKFKTRRDNLVSMEEKLKNDMAQFKREGSVMGNGQKREMERKILSAQQTLEREGQQYQQDLNLAHNQAMEDLYQKVQAAIASIAADQHYDIVLQKDAAPFAVSKFDVTALVLKKLNQKG
jgi:outer membrane protein